MNPKLLIVTLLTIVCCNQMDGQIPFNPFQLKSTQHSSFYGKVAETDASTSSKKEDLFTAKSANEIPINQSLIEPLYDSNGNPMSKLDFAASNVKGGDFVQVNINLANQGFGCQNDLKLTLGEDTFDMAEKELKLFLPEGRYYYEIKGKLSCTDSDNSEVKSHGIIDIKEGKKLQLKWELVDYQQSWMVLSE
ncbi:MAG: hypothetical protein ACPGXZ_10125 [Saprospiraceae bacterium]